MLQRLMTAGFLVKATLAFGDIQELTFDSFCEMASDQHAILTCDNDKLYLNPQKIFISEQGCLVNLDNQIYVKINHLANDAKGYFVRYSQNTPPVMKCGLWDDLHHRCKFCGSKYIGPWCRNPNCITNQK